MREYDPEEYEELFRAFNRSLVPNVEIDKNEIIQRLLYEIELALDNIRSGHYRDAIFHLEETISTHSHYRVKSND